MPFEKTFDVIVAGAGVAGVAAALECARAGLHTALVEKTVFVGGLSLLDGPVSVYDFRERARRHLLALHMAMGDIDPQAVRAVED